MGHEGVKESTSVVVLSGAKDLRSFVFKGVQMLRCAQHDRFRFLRTRDGVGQEMPLVVRVRFSRTSSEVGRIRPALSIYGLLFGRGG